jgi:lipoprotein-anchoring transpeptidase ErfK/SrfK
VRWIGDRGLAARACRWWLALALGLTACEQGVDARGGAGAAPDESQVGEAAPPEDPAEREAPAPQGPPKRIFTKRFVVNVRTQPSPEAPRTGYLRGGSALEATTAEPLGHESCKGGWYELTTGGFVCNGRDVIAFDGERLPEVRSAQPDRSAKLPYEYGFIRRDRTPMYRRLPKDEQAARFEGEARPVKAAEAGEAGQDGGAAEPEGPQEPPTLEGLMAGEDEADVLMRWLMRGFHVSLDRTFDVGRRRYWRTQQNGFVPFQQVMKVAGSDFEGLALDGDERVLPVGFVISGRTPRFVARDNGRIVRDREKPGYHHRFQVVGEREQAGRTYLEGDDGYYYRADDVVRVDTRPRPADVTDAKWVDVDLGKQTLVAYEGDRPVYVTLISSGRVRREDVPELNHATPTGTFRFSSKHLTGAMDGDSAIDGPYSIDDVPYVMYYHLAYAVHAAFWHHRFGRPKSHGCINLSPLDARWVFEWADPPLPAGWHGVYPTEDGPGTTIVIHGDTPKG